MKKRLKTAGLLLIVLAIALIGIRLSDPEVYAGATVCAVCSQSYENGFCATEGCAAFCEPAVKTQIGGTEFYEIGNAGQLYWFADLVNRGDGMANAVLTADITVNENVLQSVSIDTATGTATVKDGTVLRAWTPIGTAVQPFYGVFDGNGHSISGLFFNDASYTNVGLIGVTGHSEDGCEIRNVTLKDSFFLGKASVGAIAGRLEYTSVKNCSQTGTVCGVETTVGGIVGYGDTSVMENCTNRGSVIGVGKRSSHSTQIGGVAGSAVFGKLENCRNEGSVAGNTVIGGVAGLVHASTVVGCKNEGEVKGDPRGNSVGGIVGSVRYACEIEASVNTGVISGGSSVGGIVGANQGGFLSFCENTGSVNGNTSVGGLIGFNALELGAYTARSCRNTGAVNGKEAVGGLAGTHRSSFPIESCYNTGAVTGETKVGGLTGDNFGYLTRSYNKGSVTGNAGVGGVSGTDMMNMASACYYLKTESVNASLGGIDGADQPERAQGKSAEAFACGEVAYLLGECFGQVLLGENADAAPVFRTEKNKVYRAFLTCLQGKAVYSNDAEISESTLGHSDADGNGVCDYCFASGAQDDDRNDGTNASESGNHGEKQEKKIPVLPIVIASVAVLLAVASVGILFAVRIRRRRAQ